MTNPPTSLSRKILRFTGIGLLAGLAVIVASLVAGKALLEHRFLRQEIHLGKGSLHIHGAELDWTLRFRCDSAWYHSPALQARLGKTEARLWFPLSLRVRVDTAYIRLSATADTPSHIGKTPARAFVFPTLKLPIKAELDVRALTLEKSSVENDSGILVSAWNMHIRNPTPERVEADIGILSPPSMKNLRCPVTAFLDWSSPDSVDFELAVSREKDQIQLKTHLARADLLRGRGSLLARAADSRVYTTALGMEKKSLPFTRDTRLEVQITRGDSVEAHGVLRSLVQGFPDSLPLNLNPQKLEAHLDWSNREGRWNINSRGKTGEELSLRGTLRWIPLSANDSPAPPWQSFAATAQGYARNFRVHAGGKNMPAEVSLEKTRWDGKNLSAQLSTGDLSQVRVRAHQVNGKWSGEFSLRVRPGERWVKAFADTMVSFAALEVKGKAQGRTVTASLTARNISAYGVRLDSLFSSHVYGPRGYELTSSRLYAGEEIWSLSGTVALAKPVPILDFRFENPRHGSLEYFQGRDQFMRITARHFEMGALPYAGLARLPVDNPVLDGTFKWNPKQRAGALEAQVAAEFQKENVGVQATAHWNAQFLEVENVLLHDKESSLNVRARLKLKGRQFYELAGLRLPDCESVALETRHFDVAHVLSIFQPRPFLRSGEMQGNFAYVDAGGFHGSLAFTRLVPNADFGDAVLKRLQIDGTGDTLIILGVTASETIPLLNDSLRISVTNLLESSRRIRIDVKAADSLHLHLDAVSTHLQALQGRLQLQGQAPLPENSGLLDRLQVDVDFSVPFRNMLEKATLTTRTFEGDYTILPATRQHFSLAPALLDGTLRVPHFSLKDETGRTLQGNAQYVIKSKALHANLSGGDFALQWTENRKAALRDLKMECLMDSSGLRIQGGFSEGSVIYVEPPLYAEGNLKAVTFAFTQPPASRSHAAREPPALEFTGSLSQSLIRYRIKTLSALQGFFKKEGDKKRGGGGRIHPMKVDVKLRTLGDANRIDSDILRVTWVGDLEMHGVYPYTLVQGRINSLKGELGFQHQAYQIRQLEVKWLNAPLEEGEAYLEARKNLASSCNGRASTNPALRDSCVVITRLAGPLSLLRFSYDSDCGGAFGAGANVAALLYSVQRGCYDPAFANGGGPGYGVKALSLLEPTVNRGLSGFVGRHSYAWIDQTEISGLGSLAGRDAAAGDSLSQALSLQVTSKEFLHFRLKLRSGYHTESQDLSNPWENMLALEWRPPLQKYVDDPDWKRRLENHVSITASVQTVAVQRNLPEEDPVQKMLGLNYTYDFWGLGWGKPAKAPTKQDTAFKTGEKHQ